MSYQHPTSSFFKSESTRHRGATRPRESRQHKHEPSWSSCACMARPPPLCWQPRQSKSTHYEVNRQIPILYPRIFWLRGYLSSKNICQFLLANSTAILGDNCSWIFHVSLQSVSLRIFSWISSLETRDSVSLQIEGHFSLDQCRKDREFMMFSFPGTIPGK